MNQTYTSKRKIFNDPIYGFISIPFGIIFDLIEHPYFQRLRRITQLGLTNIVYSGANHTRFQHTLGAMHLMTRAIEVMRSKGIEITDEEAEGVTIAILLHDIGHGPYSHTLEHSIVKGISHEDISEFFMNELNKEFNGGLTLALQIFRNEYHKKFLHQLVSSQLDMDRLDYLKRDSFFTGVSEGVVGSERIIKMLNVADGELAIERKGIYSIEKFLIARRLMYWQVYLHKTVLSAEFLLTNILSRAKELAAQGEKLFCSPAFETFLYGQFSKQDFMADRNLLHTFSKLDDYDILASIKAWSDHPDTILSDLCQRLTNRRLFKIQLQNEPFDEDTLTAMKENVMRKCTIDEKDINYYVFSKEVTNSAYSDDMDKIIVLHKNGVISDIAQDADLIGIAALTKQVRKYFMCFPKNL